MGGERPKTASTRPQDYHVEWWITELSLATRRQDMQTTPLEPKDSQIHILKTDLFTLLHTAVVTVGGPLRDPVTAEERHTYYQEPQYFPHVYARFWWSRPLCRST